MPRPAPTSLRPAQRRKRQPAVAPSLDVPTLVLTWSLPYAAPSPRDPRTPGKSRPILELRLPARGTVATGSVRARMVDGATQRAIPSRGEGVWIHGPGLSHLDIPGLLHLTLRQERGGVRMLYAQTELLRGLKLKGGQYEFASGFILAT